ncbi:TPA: hypothetical protein ACGO0F_000259 [Streptococcus suis]
MVLLKKLNFVLYSIAICLVSLLFFPTDWLGVQQLTIKLTWFVLPVLGLVTLPTAIYAKNVRHILLSAMLIMSYFILFGLVTALSGLLQLNLYPLLYK